MAQTRLDPKKCVAAVQSIHDILYLDVDDQGNFHNGAKEWSVDMIERIAEAVSAVIPKPRPQKLIRCQLCHAAVRGRSVHIDRDRQNICDGCWDERMR